MFWAKDKLSCLAAALIASFKWILLVDSSCSCWSFVPAVYQCWGADRGALGVIGHETSQEKSNCKALQVISIIIILTIWELRL
jgi:hypothetical protein